MKRIRTLLFSAVCATVALARGAGAQEAPTRGWLHVVWDGDRTAGNPDGVELFVVDAAGRGARLLVDGGAAQRERLIALDRHRVEVSGAVAADPLVPRASALRVRAVRDMEAPAARVPPASASAVQPAPFITLLCKFNDDPREPFGTADAERLLGSAYPGMADYFAELSQTPGVLDGSAVAGWFTLPLPRSAYVSNNNADLGAVVRDCVGAADATVDFRAFRAVNLQVNSGLNIRATPPYDTLSWGGSWTVTADGETRQMGMTWMSRPHMGNYAVYAHEMGHALGWPHSSGPYGQVYDSRWDVMSVGFLHWTTEYGWLTIHTLAWHKDLAGWIPAARRWEPAPDTRETAVLERSALPGPTGYLIARIPLADGSFYTAETRRLAGYETPLPGEAVLLNHVVGGRAYVVDPDNNGNPNDEGAMWRVGETFTDAANQVSLRVDGQTATGFTVTITRGSPLVITSDSVLPTAQVGAPYADTLRADGLGGAAKWTVAAGALPPGLALDTMTGVLRGSPEAAGSFAFTVKVAAAERMGRKTLTVPVGAPVLQAAAVLDQLIGTAALTPDQARYLDLIGNRNGRVDVGDVRAWLLSTSQTGAARSELEAAVNAMDPHPSTPPRERP